MPEIGAGGLKITAYDFSNRFKRDFKKLDPALKNRLKDKLEDLLKNPMPPGLGFEKLKGYSDPDIYTIHVTGNYKISMEIVGTLAKLRRVSPHDDIDRLP